MFFEGENGGSCGEHDCFDGEIHVNFTEDDVIFFFFLMEKMVYNQKNIRNLMDIWRFYGDEWDLSNNNGDIKGVCPLANQQFVIENMKKNMFHW